MNVTRAVIRDGLTDDFLLAEWEKPCAPETLANLVYLFPEGLEVAREQVIHFGKLTVCWYARDDEMTHFHGRGTLFYTFTKRDTVMMSPAQFRELAERSGHRLSGA